MNDEGNNLLFSVNHDFDEFEHRLLVDTGLKRTVDSGGPLMAELNFDTVWLILAAMVLGMKER